MKCARESQPFIATLSMVLTLTMLVGCTVSFADSGDVAQMSIARSGACVITLGSKEKEEDSTGSRQTGSCRADMEGTPHVHWPDFAPDGAGQRWTLHFQEDFALRGVHTRRLQNLQSILPSGAPSRTNSCAKDVENSGASKFGQHCRCIENSSVSKIERARLFDTHYTKTPIEQNIRLTKMIQVVTRM